MVCVAKTRSTDNEELAVTFTDSDKSPASIKYRCIFFLVNMLIMNIATGLLLVLIKQMNIWEYYKPFLDIYLIGVGGTLLGAYIVICSVTAWSNYIVNVNRKRHYQCFIATMVALLSFLNVLGFVGYLCFGKSVEIVSSTIHNGMMDYTKNPLINRRIDKMQITLKCCGVHNHLDWYTTPFNAIPFSCYPTETSSGKLTHLLNTRIHRDSCLMKLVELAMNGITITACFVVILALLMGIALMVSIKLTKLTPRGYYVRDA